MSQSIFDTIVPTTTSGPQLAAILNSFKDAIVSGFSGSARPSQIQPGGYWVDTSEDASGLWAFKVFDGVRDISILSINKVTGVASVSSSESLFEVQKASTDSVGPIVRLRKKRLSNNGQTLTGDTLGELQFTGTRDDGQLSLQARIRSFSRNTVTSSQAGAYITFDVTPLNGASPLETLRVIEGKISIGGVTSPEETLHVRGSGIKAEALADDTLAPKLLFKKSRIANSGQVVSGDSLATISANSTDSLGEDIVGALIEVTATENHTATNHGTKISFKNKKLGQTSLTEHIVIDSGVRIKTDLVLEKPLTGTAILSPTKLEVKLGLESELTSYASGVEGTNGQLCFATDSKAMFQIVDGELVPAGGGGGGGSSLVWEKSGDISPLSEYIDGIHLENFGKDDIQEVYCFITIPDSYRSGKQIKLSNGAFFLNNVSGTIKFALETTLIRPGVTVLGSYPDKHFSTNLEVSAPTTANTLKTIGDLDLTSSTGQINGKAVIKGDMLRVRLFRDFNDESDPAIEDAKLLINNFELRLS